MIPVIDHQNAPDETDAIAQETARLRLEQEYAALPSNGVSLQAPQQTPQTTIKSRPVANGSNPRAIDITANFTAATIALETGQLVKDEYFTLFESVGALEIMDPKMDSGFLAPGETLEHDYDVLKELLPEEVVGIMDQLLCYEMAWHRGYPLSQTLFVSVYIDKLLWPEPRTLDEASFHRTSKLHENDLSSQYDKSPMLMLLRAYCLGLIKYCDNVIQKITSRDYFEEEDFSTHTYNRQLLTRFPEKEIGGILDHAKQWLESASTEEEVKNALLMRIKLRKQLLYVTSPDEAFDQLEDGWTETRELLTAVEKSHGIGRPVKEAFSSKIQRKLASTVPPRPVVELEFAEAFKSAVELCQDCLEVVRGTQLGSGSPQEIMAYVWTFNSRKPQPLTYARACLSSLVLGHSNDMYEEMLRKDLEELVLPSDPILDPVNWTIEPPRNPLLYADKRAMMANIINDFTGRATQAYFELWTTLCQNRCRVRRMMTHNVVAFANLQLDIEVLDQELHQLTKDVLNYPLASWTYHQKLRQMEWVVQLGFEQDIYLPDEYAGMYWWLSSIATTRAGLLERIHTFVSERQEKLAKAEQSEQAAAVLKTQQYVESLLHSARGTASLAEALCTLYILLHYLRVVPTPSRPFSSPSLRYELRMKPFLVVDTPSLPSFEAFDADVHPFGPYDSPNKSLRDVVKQLTGDTEQLIKDAKGKFAAVKKLGPQAAKSEGVSEAWTKDISNILLSCIATGLATAGLTKLQGVDKLEQLVKTGPGKMGDVESEKKYHDWWVIPKL